MNNDLQGIINVYKPKGMTSFDVVRKLRYLTKIKRIGHCGTLDPFAEGCLPICIGRATAAVRFMETYDKTYVATIALGVATDTGDWTGNIVRTDLSMLQADSPERERITAELIKDKLANCCGRQAQVPPMYSAIKVNGEKLYNLARRGIEIERQARMINIYGADLLASNVCGDNFGKDNDGEHKLLAKIKAFTELEDVNLIQLVVRAAVSKGTYIRVWGEEVAENLGTAGCLTALCRERCGNFHIENGVKLEDLQEGNWQDYLQPTSVAMSAFPRLALTVDQGLAIIQGRTIPIDKLAITEVEVPSDDFISLWVGDIFIGIGCFRHELPQTYHKNYDNFAKITVLRPERMFINSESFQTRVKENWQ